jgi:hypothetical protein
MDNTNLSNSLCRGGGVWILVSLIITLLYLRSIHFNNKYTELCVHISFCNQRQWRTSTILTFVPHFCNIYGVLLTKVNKQRKNILETCYVYKSAWNDFPIFIIHLIFQNPQTKSIPRHNLYVVLLKKVSSGSFRIRTDLVLLKSVVPGFGIVFLWHISTPSFIQCTYQFL